MNLFQRLFKRRKTLQKMQNTQPLPETGDDHAEVRTFALLNTDQRLATIMAVGHSANLRDFNLLQYAILQDPDMHVKFAALKRIHLFAAHPGLVPLLVSMQANKAGDTLEPYFSMALMRAGLISQADFEQKMNGIE